MGADLVLSTQTAEQISRSRALLLSGADLPAWRASHLRGEESGALPHGADALEQYGYDVIGLRLPENKVATKLIDVVEHRLGYPAARALLHPGAFASADVVFAALETQAITPSWLRQHRWSPYRRAPLVSLTCWLAEQLTIADDRERQRLTQRFNQVDAFVYWSTNQTAIFVEAGMDPNSLIPVNFGVDAEFYTPGHGNRDIDFLAVGRDFGRDYQTLFDAIRGTDLVVDLVCPKGALVNFPKRNVRIRGEVSASEYAALLQRSRAVVVPTHELAYPTGQSVALEASASGCCVVVTGTRPMREYFTDGLNAILVKAHDPRSLRTALQTVAGNRELRNHVGTSARSLVERSYTNQVMWAQIVRGLRDRKIVEMRNT